MADLRGYQFPLKAVPSLTDYTIVSDPTAASDQCSSLASIIALESAPRIAADNLIKIGTGLDASGNCPAMNTTVYLTDEDFAEAGLARTVINAIKLLDTAINSNYNQQNQFIRIDLTNADLLDLGTAKLKMASPGAGKFYNIVCITARNSFGTIPFVCGANGIDIRFVGAADHFVRISQAFAQLAGTQTDIYRAVNCIAQIATGIEVIATDGDLTNGDGTMELMVEYQILQDFVTPAQNTSTCCIVPLTNTFTAADLTATFNLEINHGWASQNIAVMVWDNLNNFIATGYTFGDEAGADTTNWITINFGVAIPGTYRYFLMIKP